MGAKEGLYGGAVKREELWGWCGGKRDVEGVWGIARDSTKMVLSRYTPHVHTTYPHKTQTHPTHVSQ